LIVDRNGVPLAVELTPANRNECSLLQPMLDKIPSIQGRRGRPRFRPDKLTADKAYDHVFCRAGCISAASFPASHDVALSRNRSSDATVGRRAPLRLAPRGLPSSRYTLRAPRRHPSCLPLARRRSRLHQLHPSRVLLGVLTDSSRCSRSSIPGRVREGRPCGWRRARAR
jgi:Transposase DDE domain